MKRFVYSAFIAFCASAATIVALGRLVPRAAPRAARAVTAAELSRHASAADCWLAVGGGVYDVTAYLPSHPAPPSALTDWCGKEATEAFETKGFGRPHSAAARAALENLRIGSVAP